MPNRRKSSRRSKSFSAPEIRLAAHVGRTGSAKTTLGEAARRSQEAALATRGPCLLNARQHTEGGADLRLTTEGSGVTLYIRMYPPAGTRVLFSVVLSVCVLSVLLFPAASGPFPTVRGPASEIQSVHYGWLAFGIALGNSNQKSFLPIANFTSLFPELAFPPFRSNDFSIVLTC